MADWKPYFVNIRDGVVVGTQDPDMPDGTYVRVDALPSAGGSVWGKVIGRGLEPFMVPEGWHIIVCSDNEDLCEQVADQHNYALEPQPDPRDEVFRQLECAVNLYEEYVLVAGGLRAGEWVNSARAALAAAKAVQK